MVDKPTSEGHRWPNKRPFADWEQFGIKSTTGAKARTQRTDPKKT